ncbi:TRAP transporter large permease [Alkalihalobacillus oceani]|uniref:TRAP transporter large permease n=1 Tax=Halalkalibacter oceani TaxID=1653776 RepID=A0A9X2DT13_9BACI|nr:TRAP transporter large permease [Halalkalibacter oceani]MCM3716514.1 TRAP transporter large permease [Halalkalibacter oceani]
MEWAYILFFAIVFLFALLMPGLWIAIALGVTGILGLIITGNINHISTLGNISWNTSNDFILTAIPLFLFMGEVILVSGISKKFYTSIGKWLSKVPGGLLHTNILATGIFSAISGSSVATAAGIGSVAIPEMKKRGYKKSLIYGSIASGGTLGILIPPSIVLILYGAMTETSIVRLFAAAILPGIILMVLFLIYTGSVMVKKNNQVSGEITEEITIIRSILNVFPLVLLIVLVLGSLYTGLVTPTEAAAVGSLFAIIICYAFGDLNIRKIYMATKNAIRTTSMLLFIMIGAQIFSFALVRSGVNRQLTAWIGESMFSPLVLLLVICVIYIVLGFFMDGPSILLLTLPLLFPVVMEAGYNPIWFGIVLVILIELGQITPPMGLNLFVIKGIDPSSNIGEIVKGTFPYCIIMIVMLAMLIIFPDIALRFAESISLR